MTAGPPTS
jgi:hypothetical protein